MAKLNILTFPDPRLRKVAVPVTKFDKSLENFVSQDSAKAPKPGPVSQRPGTPLGSLFMKEL